MRIKQRPPYYLLIAWLKIEGHSFSDAAKFLSMPISTFSEKINGYSDFKVDESLKLSQWLVRPHDELFFTKKVVIIET